MISKSIFKYLIVFCIIQASLFAKKIETFYGSLEIEEPILLELIDSPAFQRLKSIHQYGVAYYTTHQEEYTRYDHSLGVFAILRLKNASLEEQIAGLLHDVSHTVFSHVGDWIFNKENQEHNYQDSIHAVFLEKYGLGDILRKYDISVDQIQPLEHLFPMLEQKSPNLCADRIDYNIQGAYFRGFITYKEAMKILSDLQFIDGNWISTNPALMAKLARFPLFMTQDCWGSPTNYLSSCCLANAILRGIDLKLISYEDIHFGVDEAIWNLLNSCNDSIICEQMQILSLVESYYCLIPPSDDAIADLIIKSKFRGIDPLIMSNGKVVRLTILDPIFGKEYLDVKEKMAKGYHIKFLENIPNGIEKLGI